MKTKRSFILTLAVFAVFAAFAERNGPWPKEKAWEWYNAQPWIRGCNYMPASAANRLDMWQEFGSKERFEEMDRELALAESIGFNAVRVLLEENGFGAWYYEHDDFLKNFEKFLALCAKHKIRAIVCLGNDCSRPKQLWSIPKPGVQPCDWGYHGARKQSQHGSFPGAIGYISADDPELKPKFFQMCEEVMVKYKEDDRILFWNIWNEPGNNGRGKVSAPLVKEMFELAWKIGVKHPCAADVWTGRLESNLETAEGVAAAWSDIISYHSYSPLAAQIGLARRLKEMFGRPMINTEWLARIRDCNVQDCYPFFAQERIGCTCWGFVAGKYQTYEPWESMWRQIERGGGKHFKMTKWFHDLFRPSLRPYDPEEIEIIKRINAQMDAERKGESLRVKIAKACKITGEDMWHGYRRTKFDFKGRSAWIVEPSITPLQGLPWIWCLQWPDAFPERMGTIELVKAGFHYVTIDLFDTRMDDAGITAAAEFQTFLTGTLGLAPKANLIGISWGGFLAARYAAMKLDNVARIYLDGSLLTFAGYRPPESVGLGPWAKMPPQDGNWRDDPRMPVNLAPTLAKAKIPVLLVYGGQDQMIKPNENSRRFAAKYKAENSGEIEVRERPEYGHHPHGLEPGESGVITRFFLPRK
ncbi:MAG: alpha/beta fold hydrolase [Kiritimatiellae bacterium]|nr:alpha/beta fold hydrolase [Kiritimatiellia bacterium]